MKTSAALQRVVRTTGPQLEPALPAGSTRVEGGVTYTWQCDHVPWAIRKFQGQNAYQYEVRAQDTSDVDLFSADVERAERRGGTTYVLNTELFGAWSTKVLTPHVGSLFANVGFQYHHSGLTGNPPLAFSIAASGTFRVERRYGASASGTQVLDYTSTTLPRRGVWNHWVVHMLMNGTTTSGYLQVWLNGALIVDVSSVAFGYDDDAGGYSKTGIYRGRNSPTEILAPTIIQIANFEFGTADLSDRVTAPIAVPVG